MDEPRYELPHGADFLMRLWIVVWLFLSVVIAASQSGVGIGGAMLIWIGGSLAGSALIVWSMGGMQSTDNRDVFGGARFSDDLSEIERAGLRKHFDK